jgi:hypothetical protein
MFGISYWIRIMASNASNTNNSSKNDSFRSDKSWSKESQKLLEAGYLRFMDGTLIKWSPNQEPDPLLVQMEKLKISKVPVVKMPITMEEEVEENIKEYNRLHGKK